MNKPKKFLTIGEVVAATEIPANTLKRWSSQGIIWCPQKISYGRKGFRGFWPEIVVEQAKLVRQYIKEGNSLADARALIRTKFQAQPGSEAAYDATQTRVLWFQHIRKGNIRERLNMANLLASDLIKEHPEEVKEVAKRTMPLYALDFENKVRKAIRQRQRAEKKAVKR